MNAVALRGRAAAWTGVATGRLAMVIADRFARLWLATIGVFVLFLVLVAVVGLRLRLDDGTWADVWAGLPVIVVVAVPGLLPGSLAIAGWLARPGLEPALLAARLAGWRWMAVGAPCLLLGAVLSGLAAISLHEWDPVARRALYALVVQRSLERPATALTRGLDAVAMQDAAGRLRASWRDEDAAIASVAGTAEGRSIAIAGGAQRIELDLREVGVAAHVGGMAPWRLSAERLRVAMPSPGGSLAEVAPLYRYRSSELPGVPAQIELNRRQGEAMSDRRVAEAAGWRGLIAARWCAACLSLIAVAAILASPAWGPAVVLAWLLPVQTGILMLAQRGAFAEPIAVVAASCAVWFAAALALRIAASRSRR